MSNEIFKVYKVDGKSTYGIHAFLNQNEELMIRIHNHKFPDGRKCSQEEYETCLDQLIDDDMNLEEIDKISFYKEFRG